MESRLLESPKNSEDRVAVQPKRRRRWTSVLTLTFLTIFTFQIRNHLRTFHSLRRVPGTNLDVMDYYCGYNLDEIRSTGIDPRQVETSIVDTFFPTPIAAIALRVKRFYIPEEINSGAPGADHCSTVMLRSENGKVFFGRNFDWPHDACLVVRIHDAGGLASISGIDLHYLDLDRTNLEQNNWVERIPLLFAPYYVMDGMNCHGVAISDLLPRCC